VFCLVFVVCFVLFVVCCVLYVMCCSVLCVVHNCMLCVVCCVLCIACLYVECLCRTSCIIVCCVLYVVSYALHVCVLSVCVVHSLDRRSRCVKIIVFLQIIRGVAALHETIKHMECYVAAEENSAARMVKSAQGVYCTNFSEGIISGSYVPSHMHTHATPAVVPGSVTDTLTPAALLMHLRDMLSARA